MSALGNAWFSIVGVIDPITPPYVPVTPPNLEWLGPVAGTLGTIVVATIGAISIVWRRKQDRRDAQEDQLAGNQPKVTDGWEEVRTARLEASNYYNLYRTFENLFYTVFSALRHLAQKTRHDHPQEVFAPDVLDALAIVPPDTTDITTK